MSIKKDWVEQIPFGKLVKPTLRPLILLFCAVGLLGISQASRADGSCWVTVNSLNFGMVNSKGSSSSTNATVNCNHYGHKSAIHVAMCLYIPAGNPILANNRRRISSNTGDGDLSAYLSYDLFYDPALTQRIDTQPIPSTLKCEYKVIPASDNSLAYNMPLYGKIYASQNVKASYYRSFDMPATVLYAFSLDKKPTVTDVIAANRSATNNLFVSANYENSCVLNSSPDLDFGQVSDLSNSILGRTQINLSCPTNTSWKVSLDNGLNYSGTRRMRNGNNYIPYDLYRTADLSQIWDSAGTSQGTGISGIQQIQIYGKVPAQKSMIPAGEYTDTVTVTLTY